MTEEVRERVLEWITKVEAERPLAFEAELQLGRYPVPELHPEPQQQITNLNTTTINTPPDDTTSTSSPSSTTSCILTFCGDSFCSPSELIDLRSSSTLLSYAASDYGLCRDESISTIDLNQPANPLEAEHDDDDGMADNFVPPGQQRYTRACMRFRTEGCPNCPFLDLRGNTDGLESCTSTVFEGLITVANPKRSWVAKWQRLENYVPGVYATKVSGSIPEDIRNGLIEDGHTLIPYVILTTVHHAKPPRPYRDAYEAAEAARRERRRKKMEQYRANCTPEELVALNNILIDIIDDDEYDDDDDNDANNDQTQHDPTGAPRDGNDDQHGPGSTPQGG
ncbi:Spt4/RpoE2 zinc finger-domain-containing protein [Xylaria castorea]|nr:Spt4/RpoE2 zinc finger-domain-containing protein [Xylaria castorea]